MPESSASRNSPLRPRRVDRVLLRLDKPGPGIAALGAFTFPCGGSTMVGMNFYMYGDQAAAAVARLTPL